MIVALLIVTADSGVAHAGAWWNIRFLFRRPVEVNWESDKPADNPLAEVRFYTGGHALADGSDIRVATENGTLVASQVLMMGPGDSASVVFALSKGVRKYDVYFGDPKPPPVPKEVGDIKFETGLLLETRQWVGGAADNPEQLASSFDRSGPVLGRTIVDRAFLGPSPFGEQPQTISKLSGMLSTPEDGDYEFAASADSRGALFIDGKALIYAPWLTGDIRFNKKINLKRARHPFVCYLLHNGGDPRLSVGWKNPLSQKVDIIPRAAFGVASHGTAGPLEQEGRRMVADFTAEYEGECFIAGNYSHRYRFKAAIPVEGKATFEWDFGDGLSSVEPEADHVYPVGGVYPIRLTTRIGGFSDTQTNRVLVSRLYERINDPPTDPPAVQAKIIAGYNVDAVALRWLPLMAMLDRDGNQLDAMMAVCKRLATEPAHPEPSQALHVLDVCTMTGLKDSHRAAALALWDQIGAKSDLQPRAAKFQGNLLVWWDADFAKAAKVMEPFGSAPDADAGSARLYAEALILSQKVDAGKKILLRLPVKDDPRRQPAISGAMARSVEFYIGEQDWETGEEQWDKWESKYPAVFLEGYSVVLRVKLMQLRGAALPAAKVAEAFSTAMPNSSYAPELLDMASKLLSKTDPGKSKSLREALKKRYPEDPLSQD